MRDEIERAMNRKWRLHTHDPREYMEGLGRVKILKFLNGDLYLGEYKLPKMENPKAEDVIKHGKGTLIT